MNVLMISSIYPIPGPENQGTKVCHYFAKEWINMGYNVKSIHFQAIYPIPFYWLAKLMHKFLIAKTGAVIYTKRDNITDYYVMDNVPVLRIPLYKPLPHGKFSSKGREKALNTVVYYNKKDKFYPDIILGHFLNPQCEVLSFLKTIYPKAITALIYHLPQEFSMINRLYGMQKYIHLLENIDVIGFRNNPLRLNYEHVIGKDKPSFICYSGIPANYIAKENQHRFFGKINSFIYVGSLIERKYPALILDALNLAYPDRNFQISYVGEGQQAKNILNKANLYGLYNNVRMLGKIPRDEITAQYDKAQCMIMISKGEAYGLVYLEAMARGCITIASRGEGFDGVIIDGVNGFLCAPGDYQELVGIIERINLLSVEEKNCISKNAIETAKRLTDYNVAKMYIDDILNKCI